MSSDSSSSDSEAENELSKRVADIEAGVSVYLIENIEWLCLILNGAHLICTLPLQLLESPYYYEGYIELIKLLRQQGDLNKAREARNKMRKVFPLTEGIIISNGDTVSFLLFP